MNAEAFDKTLKEGRVTFCSRSAKTVDQRRRSGNFLEVVSAAVDSIRIHFDKGQTSGSDLPYRCRTCWNENNSADDIF